MTGSTADWAGGPDSIKLGRRVMYRRADAVKWLAEYLTIHAPSQLSAD
jgi:hypothetical protein